MSSNILPLLAVEDVGAGGVDDWWYTGAAEFPGCRFLGTAPFAEPRQRVRPPAALFGVRGAQPLLRVGRVLLVGLPGGLRVARRVDQRGDVTAGGQDEPGLPAEQLGAAVAVLPGGDVVGDPRQEVGVHLDAGQVHGDSEYGQRARC